MDADAPPFHRKVVRQAGKVDRRNIARMHVPGIFFMETLADAPLARFRRTLARLIDAENAVSETRVWAASV